MNEIWVINLNADSEDKSIKTEARNRIIPLHPQLLELGFIDIVYKAGGFLLEDLENGRQKKKVSQRS